MSYKSMEKFLGSSHIMEPYGARENYEAEKRKEQEESESDKEKVTSLSGLALSAPEVVGPPMWFCLHVMSANYPEKASKAIQDAMIGRIEAIPIEFPCAKCRPHARDYITSHRKEMMLACSGRDSLFKFFVDFHNAVNARLGKRIVPLEEARDMFITGKKPVSLFVCNFE